MEVVNERRGSSESAGRPIWTLILLAANKDSDLMQAPTSAQPAERRAGGGSRKKGLSMSCYRIEDDIDWERVWGGLVGWSEMNSVGVQIRSEQRWVAAAIPIVIMRGISDYHTLDVSL